MPEQTDEKDPINLIIIPYRVWSNAVSFNILNLSESAPDAIYERYNKQQRNLDTNARRALQKLIKTSYRDGWQDRESDLVNGVGRVLGIAQLKNQWQKEIKLEEFRVLKIIEPYLERLPETIEKELSHRIDSMAELEDTK